MMKPIIVTKINPPQQQRGVTLVEMMISLVIGLIIMIGVTQIFTANRETYSIQESLGQLQENGQYAINFLIRQLRQTGYYPNPYGSVSGTKIEHEQLAFGGVSPVSGIEGGNNANDTLITAYYTTTTDCIGDAPTGGATIAQAVTPTSLSAAGIPVAGIPAAIAINRFNIATGASGRPSLFCNGIEIAEGIESLQIRYGEDTDNDGLIDTYSDFDQVNDMKTVMIVQIAILAATIREPNREPDIKTYNLFGTIIDPVDDGRIRRVYSATIRLRNRCNMLQVSNGSRPCA